MEEAIDTNQRAIGAYHQIFGDSPEWGGVLKPNELESAIGAAQNHYYYDPEPDDALRYAQAIGKLGWRIAGNQVFANGNKRTAYGLMQYALDQNGLGDLSPLEYPDVELVDHLIAQDSYGGEGLPPEELPAQRQRLEDEYLHMWAQRYLQGGPDPSYQQRYPEGTYIADPQDAKQKWGHVVAAQDEDEWFEDYVRAFVASDTNSLPPHSVSIGDTQAGWFETTPGFAFIYAKDGTPADRHYACVLLREALAGHGIQRAQYSLEWDRSDQQMIREASWEDIEEKAKRLIQSGKVQILRNSPEVIVGQVEGDHGDYQTEIHRNDPNSEAIALWNCECEWDQFAWQRTRQWKKYEGRVCSHVLATYWMAQTMPLDEEQGPESEGPEGGPLVPGAGGMVPPGASPAMLEGQQPPQGAPQSPPVGQAPEPPSLIPEYPANPDLMPAVNPVSVPGQKPQTPLNPVQNAGGTFSHVRKLADGQQYVNGEMVQLKNADVGVTVGLNAGQPKSIPANSIGEVLGTDPTTGMVNVYFAGPQSSAGELEPHGVTGWFFPGELIPRPGVRPPGPAIRRR